MSSTTRDDKLLFLETTIQIDRVIGTQERRDTIRNNVQNRRLCTSGHVMGEFNKTLIQDAIIFRDLLLSSRDVEEAVKRLVKFNRRYSHTVDLLMTLGFDKDKQATLERLENFIEWRGHDHFWEGIDESYYTDEVGCVLRSWSPVQDKNGEYDWTGLKCLKNYPPLCQVMTFIERHRDVLATFVDAGNGSSRANVAKAAEAFGEILADRDVPFGERSNCYPISDTLIALEANADAEIYSSDGDYRVICEILGRILYSEQPIAD